MERDELRELIRETVAEVLRQQQKKRMREHVERVKAEVRRKYPLPRASQNPRPSFVEIALGKSPHGVTEAAHEHGNGLRGSPGGVRGVAAVSGAGWEWLDSMAGHAATPAHRTCSLDRVGSGESRTDERASMATQTGVSPTRRDW